MFFKLEKKFHFIKVQISFHSVYLFLLLAIKYRSEINTDQKLNNNYFHTPM